MPEPVLEKWAPKFAGWEKVLYPSQPVVAAGDIPWPTRIPKSRVETKQIPLMISMRPPVSPLKTPTQPQPSPSMHALALAWLPTPPQGFVGVTTCLHAPELVEEDLEPPVGILPVELVAAPGIASMSSSCIIKDELTGVTYITWSQPLLGGWPSVVQAWKPSPLALPLRISQIANRQSTEICHWADKWSFPHRTFQNTHCWANCGYNLL